MAEALGVTPGSVTATKLKVDDRKYPVCKKHRSDSWHLFVKDGWLYAIELGQGEPVSP